MMAKIPREQLERGVICSSAGNHAQGVALSAQKLGCNAVIVMPVTTPEIKVIVLLHSMVVYLCIFCFKKLCFSESQILIMPVEIGRKTGGDSSSCGRFIR